MKPVRTLGTAALAVSLTLGTALTAGPASAHDRHHHGDRDSWGDGDRDGWDSDRDGWDGDRDGWDGDRDGWGDWSRHRWDRRDRTRHHDWSDGRQERDAMSTDDPADNPGSDDTVSGFERRQAALVAGLTRLQGFLSAAADRVAGSSLDESTRSSVLAAINAKAATVDGLLAQARAATTKDDLRAVVSRLYEVKPGLFWGLACSQRQARAVHT